MSLAESRTLPSFSSPRRATIPSWVRRLLMQLVLLAAWQIASSVGLIGPRVISWSLRIAGTFYELTASGELPQNLFVSLERVMLGLGSGVLPSDLGSTFAADIAVRTAAKVGTHKGGAFAFGPLQDSTVAADPDFLD